MARHNTNYKNLKPNSEQEQYEASMRQLCVILVVLTVFYYVIPYILMLMRLGDNMDALYVLILAGIYPVVVFTSGFIHGNKNGFIWYVPLMIGLYFLPTALVVYQDFRFATFALMYAILAYFGEGASYLFARRKNKRHAPIGANYAVKRSMKHYEKKEK